MRNVHFHCFKGILHEMDILESAFYSHYWKINLNTKQTADCKGHTGNSENKQSTTVPLNDSIPPNHQRGKNKIISSMKKGTMAKKNPI